MHGSKTVWTWKAGSFMPSSITPGNGHTYSIMSFGDGIDQAVVIAMDWAESESTIGTTFQLPSTLHSVASQVLSIQRWDISANLISALPITIVCACLMCLALLTFTGTMMVPAARIEFLMKAAQQHYAALMDAGRSL